jgi:hypothetical protein
VGGATPPTYVSGGLVLNYHAVNNYDDYPGSGYLQWLVLSDNARDTPSGSIITDYASPVLDALNTVASSSSSGSVIGFLRIWRVNSSGGILSGSVVQSLITDSTFSRGASGMHVNFNGGLNYVSVFDPTAFTDGDLLGVQILVGGKTGSVGSGGSSGTSGVGSGGSSGTSGGGAPSGVSGAIQFSNGSAFASDATNFFWDNTNDRLGIGTNTPADKLTILGNTTGTIRASLRNTNAGGDTQISLKNDTTGVAGFQLTGTTFFGLPGAYFFTQGGLEKLSFSTDGDLITGGSGFITFSTGGYSASQERVRILANGNIGINSTTATSKIYIKGGGATSATTSLKIVNSASTDSLTITDDGTATFGNRIDVNQPNISISSIATAITNGSFIGANLTGTKIGLLVGTDQSGFSYLQGRYGSGAEHIRIQEYGSGISVGSASGDGYIGIGRTSQLASSRLGISVAPTASANYGLVSLGSGAFDGTASGFFTGVTAGTVIAVNLASGGTSDLLNLQVAGVNRFKISSAGKASYDSTITAGGTTGNQTINKPSGTVNIAAAGTTVTVTNSLVTTSSIVMAVIRTNDSTAYIKNVVPNAGSFDINLGAAATAEVSIGWIVNN